MKWIHLFLAVIFETIATSSLKASEGFTQFTPTVIMVLCYAASFYLLSLTLNAIPVGIAYAIWSAVGIVLITLIGYFRFGQTIDLPAMIGISLIIIGVVTIQLFSKSIAQ